MFIDATYEGDLMAAAGVTYHVGREANDVYGETLNGVQPKLNVKNHRFTQPVDPYVKPGDPASGLLWGIQAKSLPPDGSGDRAVQAYCYRLCTTDVPENRRPWPKPADYDESRYELLLRNFEAGDDRVPVAPALDAQSQDRHEQQPRVLDRLHRRQLRVPRSRLRHAREDRRRSPLVSAGADVDARQSPARAGESARRSSSGSAWRRMSSSTTTTGRRSSTSAKRGG